MPLLAIRTTSVLKVASDYWVVGVGAVKTLDAEKIQIGEPTGPLTGPLGACSGPKACANVCCAKSGGPATVVAGLVRMLMRPWQLVEASMNPPGDTLITLPETHCDGAAT